MGKSPYTLPLLQREGPSHGRQFSTNFSNVSPSHRLQLFTNCPSVVPSMECSPSGTGWSSVGPLQGHKPCQQTCSGVDSSLHRSAGPGRGLLQRGLPTGSQLPSGIHLLQRGVPSTGYRWISAPPWTSVDCRETTSLAMVFVTSCKGRLSAPTFQVPPPPPSLTLVSAELFLSHSLTPLSRLPLHCSFFLPFLNMLSQRRYHHP